MHHQQKRPFCRRIVPGRRIDVHLQGDRLRDAAVEHEFDRGTFITDGGMGIVTRGGGIGNILFHRHLIGGLRKGESHGDQQAEQTHHQKLAARRRPNRVVFSIFSSNSSGVL